MASKQQKPKILKKTDLIDINEINDTMVINQDLIKILIQNYHSNMVKVGHKGSNFGSLFIRTWKTNR